MTHKHQWMKVGVKKDDHGNMWQLSRCHICRMTKSRPMVDGKSKAVISKFKGKKEVYDKLVETLENQGVEVKVRKGSKTLEFTDNVIEESE